MTEEFDPQLEMSRYIDLELYHKVEKQHPFYVEMEEGILKQIRKACPGRRKYRVLEFGAGTGLFTQELLKIPNLEIDAVEVDRKCCKLLRRHLPGKNCRVVQESILTYCKEGYYDIIVSTFAHDHISYEQGVALVRNFKRNLRPGGLYIMGGEVLPHYKTKQQRREALYTYHGYIVDTALRAENFKIAQIEINALQSGLGCIGDFKRHEKLLESEFAAVPGVKPTSKIKVGPKKPAHVGGVFIYTYQFA